MMIDGKVVTLLIDVSVLIFAQCWCLRNVRGGNVDDDEEDDDDGAQRVVPQHSTAWDVALMRYIHRCMLDSSMHDRIAVRPHQVRKKQNTVVLLSAQCVVAHGT